MTTFARALLLACLVFMSTVSSVSAQSTRLTVFISDTHFGVGKQGDGQWHPYEDARWASEFAPFLETISRQGNGATDLVLNGDTFELWQSLQNDCVYQNENLGCTEADALRRMRVVLAAHTREMEALRKFVTEGSNTVSIVPGNHDAALVFPGVAAEVLKAIGAPASRARVVADGFWVSNDGLILAEHGHQIGKDVNKFSSWPKPFVERRGVNHLRKPWGEEFVQDFYNQFELKYPIIDNLADEISGVKYGLAAEGRLGAVRDVGRFINFYLTQTSFTQLAQALGGDERGPKWDVGAMRAGGDRFLVESLPTDDPIRQLAETAAKEGTLGVSVSDLSDDEIRGICARRAAIVEEDQRLKQAPRLSPCRQSGLGAAAAAVRSRDSIFREHLKETNRRLLREGRARVPFTLFIFSHTHRAEASYAPFDRTNSAWKPIVMNTGAWQRTISDEQIKRYMTQKNLQPADVLKMQPQDLPPCYPVVFIPAYAATPQGTLRYWRQRDGGWLLDNRCE